jgi:hypothetical protein
MQIEIGILGLLGVALAGFIGGSAACGLASWGFHRLWVGHCLIGT